MKKLQENNWFYYLTTIVACFICYGSSLKGEFVFDDSVAIVRNTDVTNHRTPINIIFNHDFWGYNITDPSSHKSYRPLTILTFHWENRLFGLHAFYMKILNLILHCLICCILVRVLDELFPIFQGFSVFLVAILFAVHPVHSEAVAGIVGRAELMCTVLYLMTILIYLQLIKNAGYSKFKACIRYAILASLTAAALLCKETGITILSMCIAYDLIVNTNIMAVITFRNNQKYFKRDVIIRCSVLCVITMALVYMRLKIINYESPKFKVMDNPVAAADNLVTRILSQSFLYALNFWLLLCPDWLSFDWALGSIQLIESPRDIRILSLLLLYLVLFLLFLKGCRNTHIALALMIIPFLPASGIVKLGFVIAERVLYIPSIGFCILIVIGLNRLCQYFRKFRYIWYAWFGLLVIAMCLKTRSRAYEWTNEELLFKSGLRVCPNNAKIYYNIARLSSDKNDMDNAFKYYHKAISLFPNYEAALMNLGNLYREQNNLELAESYLRRSISILEEFPAAWMNLGIVQASRRKYDKALASYKNALKYRKHYATCYYNMGNLYIEMNNKAMALKSWQEAVAINPRHSKAWANILAFLDNTGNTDEVIKISTTALEFVPDEPAILFARANAYGKLEKFEKSENIYKKIIKLRPNHALYHVNLGVLYHRWNRKENAIEAYRNALKIDPNLRSARENLLKLTKIE